MYKIAVRALCTIVEFLSVLLSLGLFIEVLIRNGIIQTGVDAWGSHWMMLRF